MCSVENYEGWVERISGWRRKRSLQLRKWCDVMVEVEEVGRREKWVRWMGLGREVR